MNVIVLTLVCSLLRKEVTYYYQNLFYRQIVKQTFSSVLEVS
jgi:hypothetical protein